MNLTSFLYGLARASAWARAGSKATRGNVGPLAKRVRNRAILKGVGRFLR